MHKPERLDMASGLHAAAQDRDYHPIISGRRFFSRHNEMAVSSVKQEHLSYWIHSLKYSPDIGDNHLPLISFAWLRSRSAKPMLSLLAVVNLVHGSTGSAEPHERLSG
jgi:hypothetical protein